MPTLAQARRRKLLSQRALAAELGVNHTLVSAWERGVNKPRLNNLMKLCQVLQITPQEIEFTPNPKNLKASPEVIRREAIRRQIEAHDESMGYVDSSWLRGGRYDIDPASHEASS